MASHNLIVYHAGYILPYSGLVYDILVFQRYKRSRLTAVSY